MGEVDVTSPIVVGQVAVEVEVTAKDFARRLTNALEKELRGAKGRFQRLIDESVGSKPVKIPVEADTSRLRVTSPTTRPIKLGVEVDEVQAAAAGARASRIAQRFASDITIGVDVDGRALQRFASTATSALGSVGQAGQAAGQAAASGAVSAGSALSGIANPASLAAVAIGGTVAALFAIGPAAGAAAGAIGVLAGAIASLPALAVGGAGVFGAFGLALAGVGDAFKSTAKAAGGGGGSIANSGRQVAAARRAIEQAERGVAAAERNLANAHRDAKRAQDDINRARLTAKERIEDLGRSLRGAAQDEREAAIRLREAERELEATRKAQAEAADPNDVRHVEAVEKAQLAYDQATLSLENAKDATEDLKAEKADSDRKGVEGSDEVTAAYDRQRAAQEQVLAAQDSLKSAQDSLIAANDQLAAAQQKVGGSAGGAAKQMLKLAPAAQKFVDAVKRLKPAFEDLRLSVQQRFFAGLDKTITRVGRTWIPVLKEQLGGFADAFNTFFKDLGTSITTPKFVDDISAAMSGFRKNVLDPILKAISGPGVKAFGSLAKAAQPFLKVFGSAVAKGIESFSAFIERGEKSGKLNQFFTKAGEFLEAGFKIGGDVARIFKSLAEILFGVSDQGSSGFVEFFDKLANFLEDPKNQETIKDYLNTFREIGKVLVEDVIPFIGQFLFFIGTVQHRVDEFKNFVKDTTREIESTVKGAADNIATTVSELPGKVSRALSDLKTRATTLASQTWSDVAARFQGGVNRAATAVGSLPGRAGTALSSLKTQIGSKVSSAVDGAVDTLRGMGGRAQSAVSGVAGAVKRGVGDLGRTLYNAGRGVIAGLIDGITSKLDSLKGFLGDIKDKIAQWKGPLEDDRKILIPAGRVIMEGLIEGIDGQRAALHSELAAVTSDIAGGVQADVTARVRSSVAAPLGLLESMTASLSPADVGVPDVRVFIGERELTDIVDVQVSERSYQLKRRATAAGARVG
jgi:phage-related protein